MVMAIAVSGNRVRTAVGRIAWRDPAVVITILAHLWPLGGVLWLGWDVFSLMLLFWLENLVVGLFTLLRILRSRGSGLAERIFVAPFFCIHYGMFCLVHGVFVFALFGPPGMADQVIGNGPFPDPVRVGAVAAEAGLLPALGAILAIHGWRYFIDFLRRGGADAALARKEMSAPYGRIVVLHVVLLFGGWIVIALGQPLAALGLLVLLKLGLDLGIHARTASELPQPSAGSRAESLT